MEEEKKENEDERREERTQTPTWMKRRRLEAGNGPSDDEYMSEILPEITSLPGDAWRLMGVSRGPLRLWNMSAL